jgi:hypothetical protein
MNNHLREVVKKRFKVSLDALPEREHRVVQHFGDRRHISHATNLEFASMSLLLTVTAMAQQVSHFD